jgi:uncharacterized protein (TIGR02594 family)
MAATFTSAKYDVATRTVDYARSDGKHLLRTGGTIAWRFNNPGNIRPASSGKLIMGAIGIGKTKGNGSFLIFASYEAGRAQKKSLLRRKYNDRTIYTMLAGIPDKNGKLVMGYAPASDNNDPMAYAEAISKHTGLSTDTTLSSLTDEQLDKVLDAMERKEGFHGQKESRSERWVDTTSVTISDGAAPKPGLPVKVKIGEKIYDQKTNARGELPKIAHTTPGQKVEVQVPTLSGGFEKGLEFVMDKVSNAYVLFHDLISFDAPTAPVKPRQVSTPPGRQPVRYPVKGGDTLGKIAKRFKCSVSSILELNPQIKDASKIYEGQVLSIYGRTSDKPARRPAAPSTRPAAPARSKEGKGAPLAIVPADQRSAPWMPIAFAEGKRWGGADEEVITTKRNYHKEIDTVGKLHTVPWCASFVNYCLKESGTPFVDSQSSQFPTSSKKFIKVKRPVYGAILVMRNYYVDTGKYADGGHVAFVYAKTNDTTIAAIGGNQGDTVKLSPYKTVGVSSRFTKTVKKVKRKCEQRFHGFYVPATYAEYAEKAQDLDVINLDEANQALLGIAPRKKTANESTR